MRISWLEKTFAVFTLFLFTKPFIDTGLVEDGWISKQGDYLVWGVFLSVYAAAFLLLGRRQFLEWASKDKLLLLLLSFVLLSLAWSEDPPSRAAAASSTREKQAAEPHRAAPHSRRLP